MRVYIATKNLGKLRELEAILAPTQLEPATYADYADVIEGEVSYGENAALKARSLRAQLAQAGIRAAVLGDDSGLEVRALDGRPGVLSARYAGPSATWAERRARLLAEIAHSGNEDRSARFVCALHFIAVDGREHAVEASLAGAIAETERGAGGFSYDAVFTLPERRMTFAELSPEEKNLISHRALAVSALVGLLDRDLLRRPEQGVP
jgi:XTP/dITP diphosphohydrolase